MDHSKNTSTIPARNDDHATNSRDIVESATNAGQFSTFLSAVRAAGLAETLTGKGPWTVFAPTDEAFKKLAPGALDALLKDASKLKAVLNYHVVAGRLARKDVKSGPQATVQGTPLTINLYTSGTKVNGAMMTGGEIPASNGILHAIDAVVMPQNWQLLAAA